MWFETWNVIENYILIWYIFFFFLRKWHFLIKKEFPLNYDHCIWFCYKDRTIHFFTKAHNFTRALTGSQMICWEPSPLPLQQTTGLGWPNCTIPPQCTLPLSHVRPRPIKTRNFGVLAIAQDNIPLEAIVFSQSAASFPKNNKTPRWLCSFYAQLANNSQMPKIANSPNVGSKHLGPSSKTPPKHNTQSKSGWHPPHKPEQRKIPTNKTEPHCFWEPKVTPSRACLGKSAFPSF